MPFVLLHGAMGIPVELLRTVVLFVDVLSLGPSLLAACPLLMYFVITALP